MHLLLNEDNEDSFSLGPFIILGHIDTVRLLNTFLYKGKKAWDGNRRVLKNHYRNLSEEKTLQLTWLWKKMLNITEDTGRYSSRAVKHTFL